MEDTLAVLGFELVIREIGDERVRCESRRPRMGAEERARLLKGWRGAVKAAIIAAE